MDLPISPLDWGRTFSAPPILEGEGLPGRSGPVRRWKGTAALMRQPPIDHHVVVLHLGGPKRVRREGEGASVDVAVPEDALSFLPAGSTFTWRTEGPIDFAHLYVRPDDIRRILSSMGRLAFDGDLPPRIGVSDVLLANLMKELLREASRGLLRDELYIGALLDTFLGALTRRYVEGGRVTSFAAVAPRRLWAVLDYVEAHLSERLTLSHLSGLAQLSTSHFSKVFHDHLRQTPAAYVERRRIERAMERLKGSDEPIGEVGRSVGFPSPSHFSRRFQRLTGVAPSAVRSGRRRS